MRNPVGRHHVGYAAAKLPDFARRPEERDLYAERICFQNALRALMAARMARNPVHGLLAPSVEGPSTRAIT